MKNTTPLVLLMLLLATILSACSDSNSSTTSSSGDGVTGDLIGSVTLFDYRGRSMSDKSGVLIQCEGTSYSAVSASDGSWVIHNLPTRNYSIAYSKDGFSTYKVTTYQYIGGNVQRIDGTVLRQPCRFTMTIDGFIMAKSDTTITNDSTGGHSTNRTGNIYSHTSDDTPDSVYVYATYLFGRSESMNPLDPNSYVVQVDVSNPYPNKTPGQVNFSATMQYTTFSKFKPGERIYVVAYPYLGLTSYYDVRTGVASISGGYGAASNVLSAIMQ
ncbi:MAG TPA: carboxypeptidase-like regulatory domain-containing protein [Candidatus Kapabacteria bacterium]|nr:carboxypeptidase-like regulatory domain-containing protein [Candidatus Kapabacteria bacterium]